MFTDSLFVCFKFGGRLKIMASPDLPPPPLKHKDDEQGSGTESKLDNCQGTGRKCEIAQSTGVKEIEMKDAEAVDGPSDQGIKEIEMQDAEVVYNRTTHVEEKSREDSVADVHEESKMHPESNLKGNEGCKQDEGTKETEQGAKYEEFERNEKQSIPVDTKDGSGQQALGEVATLLKQVQESDAKAKVEVEVK